MHRRRNKRHGRRQHRLVLSLNDEEMVAIENYCQRYKHSHQSRGQLLRELLLREMIEHYEQDSPLLFSEEEMR